MSDIGIDALFEGSDDLAWQDLMNRSSKAEPVQSTLEPGAYLALFNTALGREVLKDMYNRYVNVTRAIPGQGAEAAFYREGMAQVVFDIVHKIAEAQRGETDG